MWRGIKQLVIATSVFYKPTERNEFSSTISTSGFAVRSFCNARAFGAPAILHRHSCCCNYDATAAVTSRQQQQRRQDVTA